jgi:RNA polymerase sigma-70 factor, ECF subfamily
MCNQTGGTMSELNEMEIVEKAKGGDMEAFAEIARRYGDRVYRFVYSRIGSQEDAYDAAQDVMVQVLESIKTFRGESKFSTWLYSVALNYCRNYRRKMSRAKIVSLHRGIGEEETELPIPDTRENTENKVLQDELLDAIRTEMKKLPDDYREILHLRDIEGMPYEEIASVTGITLSNVKVRIHRGREMLRKRLAVRGFI